MSNYVLVMNRRTGAGPFSVKEEAFAKEIELELYEPKMIVSPVIETYEEPALDNEVLEQTADEAQPVIKKRAKGI